MSEQQHRNSGGVSAVLVAAGESVRMGATNKLLIEVDGQPMLRRTVSVLLASQLTRVLVVLGHEAERCRDVIADLPVELTINPDYREGQQGSVDWGLRRLDAVGNAVMICLADQPLLTATDIDFLIGAYRSETEKSILVPEFQGQRGNPVILAAQEHRRLLSAQENIGCRRFIDNHPDRVWRCPVNNRHFTTDIDTPEDARRVLAANQGPSG